MKRPTVLQLLSISLWIIYTIFYLSGIPTVPYHPDEATQIYMSDEIAAPLIKGGISAFDRGQRDHYRMIDSPLTHTVIGLERLVTGDTHVRSDWNWGYSWDTNQSVGALPSRQTLVNARLALSWLFPISLMCFYLVLKMLIDEKAALITCLLFGLNSILLVHTRRAMAEGLQLSLVLLLLYLVLSRANLFKNLMAILVAALLIQTKQLAYPIVAVCMLIFYIYRFRSGGLKSVLRWVGTTGIVVFGFHYLLNPILRPDPIQITIQMFLKRMEFSNWMLADFARSGSGLALTTPGLRFLGLLAQTFFAPTAYLDTANYVQNVLPEITSYETNLFNVLLSPIWVNIVLIVLFLAGLISGILDWFRTKSEIILIFVITTVGLIAFYVAIISIGFQRYYIQILPFVYFWIGLFFHKILSIHIRSKKE